ncbi:hypothetical protein FRC03_004864 [Tulasnella sp. 419]|nr:hypothetical protein FRC03_004864 [Tulasnella sp. 419]
MEYVATWRLQHCLGIASEDGVELVFCNPDLLWRSDYPLSRFGQGAFKDALQAVYKSVTGRAYPYVQYGKPHKPTYDFASKVLEARRLELEGSPGLNKPRIYMVGDNPDSDIAGGNAAGWESILVRTGVYNPANGPPHHRPTVEVQDVEEAVQWAWNQLPN